MIERDGNKQKEFDVIVAGGGPSGVAAAIAAARNGARTLIIEREGYFGGMATAASIPAFCTFTDGINTIIKGIGLEILERLKKCSWKSPFYDQKPDRIEGLDWLPIDAEALKLVLDEMTASSGCSILFHTSVIGCRTKDDQITELSIYNKSGIRSLSAQSYIDCTGDADLAALAGCEMQYGDEKGRVQAGTLCFKIANFNTDKFLRYAKETGENGNLLKAAERAKENGEFPEGEVKVAGIALPAPGMASLNFGHVFDFNPVDGNSLTQAELAARKKLPELMAFLKKYVPGAEEAVLACSGPGIGIRESRRVIGKYYLTMEDYRRRADFEDSIAHYAYPIDLHASDLLASEEMERHYQETKYRPGESYGIPYRCLLPKKIKNLLTAGRSISCDRSMQASIRVMPSCFATGQAAGTAAALASDQGVSVQEISARELRNLLKIQGCYLK